MGRSLKVDDSTYDRMEFRCLRDVLIEQNTTAFLIMRHDTLLYEEYFQGYDAGSQLSSFSIVKSFMSALIGIVISEGKLSLQDPVTQYIPEVQGKPGFENITIQHLLNHTTPIHESVLAMARLYYGRNIKKAFKKLKLTERQGTQQFYGNINTQLLGSVLREVTGKSCAAYLQEKLWIPLGMESDAFWSLDRKEGQEKTFCCLNATTRDFAKLGRLYMHRGNWEGTQLVPEAWVDQSLARDTTHGSSWGYNHSWYLGEGKNQDFFAVGLYKQYIYVDPEDELVMVRLGNRTDRVEAEKVGWRQVFREIGAQLQDN